MLQVKDKRSSCDSNLAFMCPDLLASCRIACFIIPRKTSCHHSFNFNLLSELSSVSFEMFQARSNALALNQQVGYTVKLSCSSLSPLSLSLPATLQTSQASRGLLYVPSLRACFCARCVVPTRILSETRVPPISSDHQLQ